MESLFQNSVTEFDLNFLDQTTNVTPSTQCPVSRKQGIARIKDRLKGLSQVVHKAKHTNQILLEVQKELLQTKQDLEETRTLLFEKNEEHKIIYDERSAYFKQASDYSNEIQKLKEQLKQLKEKDYESKLKDQIIQGYSDQMTALQTEMDNLMDAKKQSAKEASYALIQANKDKNILEKKLIRLLSDYVYPTIKKRDKWLQSLIKKHLPSKKCEGGNSNFTEPTSEKAFKDDKDVLMSPKRESKEEESLKIQKPSVETVIIDQHELNETILEDVVSSTYQSALHRNNSLDFEFVGSVDTGRGSSLAFSDGEKSFHSPDYFMNDSPPCSVPNLCNKCNTLKANVSTSPIPQETFDITDSLAIDSCKGRTFLPIRDACTSPMLIKRFDVATDTVDISYEKDAHSKKTVTTRSSPEKQLNVTSMICHPIIRRTSTDVKRTNEQANTTDNEKTALKYISISSKESSTNLGILQDNVPSKTYELVNNVKSINNTVENITRVSAVDLDEVALRHISISNKCSSMTPVNQSGKKMCNTDKITNNNNRIDDLNDSATNSPIDFDDATTDINSNSILNEEPPTNPIKLWDDAISDNEDPLADISRTSSPVDDLTIISSIDFAEATINPYHNSDKELSRTPSELRNKSPNVKQNICNTLQERECLELNNTNNFCNDSGNDSEVQTILNNMRLQHRLITPIPKTPPRGIMLSPSLKSVNQSSVLESERKLITGGISEQLNILRTKVQEVFTPFVQNLSKYVQQIPQLLTDSEPNEELLRNLLSNPNSTNNKLTSHKNTQELLFDNRQNESRNNTQTQLMNLKTVPMMNSMQMKNNIFHANNGNTSDDNVEMHLDLDSEDLKHINEETCKRHAEICHTNKNYKIIFASKMEASNFVTSQNFDAAYDKRCHNSNDGHISHETSLESITNINTDIDSGPSTQANVTHLDTTSTLNTLETRKNIVFESDCNASNDAVMQQDLGSADVEEIRKGKNNNDENEQMSQNQLSNQIISNKTRKMKKLTKLDKLRLKMVPKGKIRNEVQRSVKKPLFKPSPIIISQPVPKKKVTESDSAASLNDKSVYENAVKVIAASKARLEKEPVIVVEDCVLKTLNSPPKSANSSKNKEENLTTDNSNTSNNRKRKLLFESENVPNVSVKHGEYVETNKCKRERPRTCSDDEDDAVPLKQLRQKIQNIENDKSQTVDCRRRSSLSLNKSVLETIGAKRNNELVHIFESSEPIHNNETKLPKRQRTSVSESQSPHNSIKNNNKVFESRKTNNEISISKQKDSVCEITTTNRLSISTRQSRDTEIDHTVLCSLTNNKEVTHESNMKAKQTMHDDTADSLVSSSQRILRSSYAKQNKESGCEKTPIVAPSNLLSIKNSSKELHSKADQTLSEQNNITFDRTTRNTRLSNTVTRHSSESNQTEPIMPIVPELVSPNNHDSVISYEDLSMFTNKEDYEQDKTKKPQADNNANTYRNNLLCRMIEKHGVQKIKYFSKKIPDIKVNAACSKLETSLSEIVALPHDQSLGAMKRLVLDIRNWDVKHFLVGLIKYFKNPQRKIELFKKISCPPAPPMTYKEQVLLYVIDELQHSYEYRNIVKKIFMNIEYVLFALNKTPEEIDVIETMSHFYALLCRSYQKISKLRLFIIDAMYCLQYKSIVLIKQCLDVWMFVLPLGHMGLAKTPLVACLVYLLHFYKCEDKFDRIQDIRFILRRKYNYDLTDWNETKILELFKTAITEIRDIPIERKMLRLALIILAKRNGPTWCQNNIVKKMLQPMIKDKDTSDLSKRFCVSMLGPLLKPYPNNMKVHCEMINDYLLDMLDKKNSPKMQEAIITSLICLNKQNNRLIQFLIKWDPKHVTPEFEIGFREYIRTKPVKKWKTILSSLT